MPAFATDVFGARNAGTIYGVMLTGWSVGAIVGPLLIVVIPNRTALPLIAGILALAAPPAAPFQRAGSTQYPTRFSIATRGNSLACVGRLVVRPEPESVPAPATTGRFTR
jgi:hypothetical protein